MTNDKKNGFEGMEGGEIVRMQNRNKSQLQKKIKFKTKIRGRKKVKWSKEREKHNMRFEINCNIKTSDLISQT